ncbi:MAG TPA: HAMP domain-containing sensor histidine kinase [Actinomycetota bacterium]|nr:HAMP domain-containing sensor histidine kinase [Actinomycetota bacterium]
MRGGGRATSARQAGVPVLALYRLAVAVPAALWLVAELAWRRDGLLGVPLAEVAGWVAVLALFELLPGPRRAGPGLSVAFAALVAVALLYQPPVAAAIAFVAAVDRRELHWRGPALRAFSHRGGWALTAALGSATFHLLATVDAPWPRLLASFVVTALLMHAVATALQVAEEHLDVGTPVREALARLERASPYPFPADVPGMAWFGLPLARLYDAEGFWPTLILLGLLWYARKMCLSSVELAGRLADQNQLLAEQADELRVHLAREQKTVAELQRLNRMQGQFVAMASHEVRTPLTAIIGYATTLRRAQVGGDPRLRATFLDIIERQARRLLALVESLLTSANLERGELAARHGPVSVAALCAEAVESLGTAPGQVRLSLPADLPPLVTDRRYLGQVLGNLLENAIKYAPPGSVCELGARRDGGWLALWVHDHGGGIPDAELGRIFDRFYQVDASDTRAATGVGLGLSLVQDLVHLLGGTVSVTSRVGEGSCFTVRLPLSCQAAPVPEASDGQGPPQPERPSHEPVRARARPAAAARRRPPVH